MRFLSQHLEKSPVQARVIPFFIFIGITALQGSFGEASRFWMYGVKTFVGAWLVYEMWPYAREVRWAFSWEAVVVGVLVLLIWIGLDPYYGKFSKPPPKLWNPHDQFGQNSIAAWSIIVIRIIGSSLVVPPLEEMFYRSFLYRYLVKIDFLAMPLKQRHWLSFGVTSTIFGLLHYEWLAGILCGMAYQWLVIRKDRLGDAMTAHAITNFLLGVYIAWKGDWHFW
jgi:CAAX prenyl protease-like protein